jgi:peroxiredoxin Q/BCP
LFAKVPGSLIRRQLLVGSAQGAALLLLGLLGLPRRVFALGGTLPDLNTPAPEFTLAGTGLEGGSNDGQASLEGFRGRWLVLYFYPKDFTGGCTLEARGFQKDLATFHARGAEVVGISADSPDQHASFCDNEGLRFSLLSDPDGTVSRLYGSWMPPFSQRHTFLIDPQGVLRARWVAVRPMGHSQDVLAKLNRLQTAGP